MRTHHPNPSRAPRYFNASLVSAAGSRLETAPPPAVTSTPAIPANRAIEKAIFKSEELRLIIFESVQRRESTKDTDQSLTTHAICPLQRTRKVTTAPRNNRHNSLFILFEFLERGDPRLDQRRRKRVELLGAVELDFYGEAGQAGF